MPFGPFNEVYLYNNIARLVDANTPGEQQLNPSVQLNIRLDAIYLSNSDVIDHIVTVVADTSGDDVTIGSVNLPARTGYDGLPAVEFFLTVYPTGPFGFPATANCGLWLTCDDALGAGVVVAAVAVGGSL